MTQGNDSNDKWTGPWPWSGRRGYHHGRLKEALIAAARDLVARHGPAGFTLSEAAKLAGVTPAAPYRHFSDRDALMVEVARIGFEQFRARLHKAWDEGRPDPLTAFARMGRAYLDFAREETGFYFAMFSHAQRLAGGGEKASQDAFDALAAAAADVLRYRNVSPAQARRLANEVWALSHGAATLMLGRYFNQGDPDCDPNTILDSAVHALIEQAVWRAQGKGE
ncbi:MAG: TetR/AcrR family transcriptional regulator [Alphaproteobacteria bacterium]|nr:TetR/AcrR family transcriptional regulator [Alphaproteobacteria bacterium]